MKDLSKRKQVDLLQPVAKRKNQHQAVNRKGKETQKLSKPKEEFQNNAIKQYDKVKEKHGTVWMHTMTEQKYSVK